MKAYRKIGLMNEKKKIAIVTPIFSDKALGGAERISLEYAKLLSKNYSITVLTSTSQNYQTWESVYPSGKSSENDIEVNRFQTKQKRNSFYFNLIHRKILKHFPNVSEKKYEKWLIEQGPFVPDLVEYIRLNENKFDLFIFFTYLYYPIVKSLPFVKSKAICVLTLHDEPPAYFPFYKKLFTNDLVYSFNTLEEKDVFKTVFGFTPKRHIVAGMNIELACIPKVQTDMEKYIVYVGRIEDGKGVGELINYFKSYKQRRNENLKLYLIGGGKNHWEADEDIIFKGYVSEEDKYMYIQNSVLLVNSSPMESFSIVLMEAWLLGRAVLVNAKCMTLKNHCQRSNAGLYYQDEDSFIECLDYLIKNESIATKMGLNGKRYVEGNYSSEIIESKLKYIVSMAIELKKTSFA